MTAKASGKLRALGNAGLFAAARLIQIVVILVATRTMTKDNAGGVLYLLGYLTLAQSVCSLGLEYYGNYHFPRLKRRGRLNEAWQFLALVLLVAVPLGAVSTLGLLTYGEILQDASLGWIMLAIALAIVASTVRRVSRTVLVASNQRALALLHDTLLFNLALIAAIMVVRPTAMAQSAALIAAASGVAFVAALFSVGRTLGLSPASASLWGGRRKSLATVRRAIPAFIAQSAPLILNRADVLLIAPLASVADVASYSVAIRLTFAISVFMELEVMLYGPKLLNSTSLDKPGLRQLCRKVMLESAAVAFAAGLILMLFAKPLIGLLFGAEYTDATLIFQVLVLGKMLTAPFLPIQTIFAAHGQSRSVARILLVGAATSLALFLFLIPRYGALGAAIATSATLVILSIGYVRLLTRMLRPA